MSTSDKNSCSTDINFMDSWKIEIGLCFIVTLYTVCNESENETLKKHPWCHCVTLSPGDSLYLLLNVELFCVFLFIFWKQSNLLKMELLLDVIYQYNNDTSIRDSIEMEIQFAEQI